MTGLRSKMDSQLVSCNWLSYFRITSLVRADGRAQHIVSSTCKDDPTHGVWYCASRPYPGSGVFSSSRLFQGEAIFYYHFCNLQKPGGEGRLRHSQNTFNSISPSKTTTHFKSSFTAFAIMAVTLARAFFVPPDDFVVPTDDFVMPTDYTVNDKGEVIASGSLPTPTEHYCPRWVPCTDRAQLQR